MTVPREARHNIRQTFSLYPTLSPPRTRATLLVERGRQRRGLMRLTVVNLTSGGLSGKYLSRLMPPLASDPSVAALTVFVPEGADVGMEHGYAAGLHRLLSCR